METSDILMDTSILLGKKYKDFTRRESELFYLLDMEHHRSAVEQKIGGPFGLHGGTHARDCSSQRAVLESKELFTSDYDKPIFLDLGFGAGRQLIYAAHHGWQAYGIDLSSRCLDLAQDAIIQATNKGYIEEGSVRIAQGNFFPRDFDRFGRSIDDVLSALSDVIPLNAQLEKKLWKKGFAVSFKGGIRKLKKECKNRDPYADIDLALEEVDLFYHYQVERHNRIVRLFSERAKKGAFLLFNRSLNDTPKAYENVRVVEQAGKDLGEGYILVLYKKVA